MGRIRGGLGASSVVGCAWVSATLRLSLVAVLVALAPAAHAQPSASVPSEAPKAQPADAADGSAQPEPSTPAPAAASPGEGEAKALARGHFERGVGFYRDGRFADALSAFLDAERLYPSPVFQFNAGRASEELGDAPGALNRYREYLRRAPNAKDEADVAQRVAKLERELQSRGIQQVTILSQPAGATVRVDGQPVGLSPWTGQFYPGMHRLALELEGYQGVELAFELPPHRAIDVDTALEPLREAAPSVPATNPVPLESTSRSEPGESEKGPLEPPDDGSAADGLWAAISPWTWGAFGASAASFGAAGVFELMRQSSAEAARTEETQLARVASAEDYDSETTTAGVFLGIGAGFAVVGAALLVWDLSESSTGSTTTAFGCDARGCAAMLGGSFE